MGVAARWVGSVRRDLLDHVMVLNRKHLRRLLNQHFQSVQRSDGYLRTTVDYQLDYLACVASKVSCGVALTATHKWV